jgi:hypothetical protein
MLIQTGDQYCFRISAKSSRNIPSALLVRSPESCYNVAVHRAGRAQCVSWFGERIVFRVDADSHGKFSKGGQNGVQRRDTTHT